MEITAALIERFFEKACTISEAEVVVEYLEANPEVLDKYLKRSEMDEADAKMPLEFWGESWEAIRREIRIKRRVVVFKRLAMAACTAGFVLLGYFMWPKAIEQPSAKLAKADDDTVIVNDAYTGKKISMPDGSEIVLSPLSKLTFKKEFKVNRNITLSGEALFTVAHDKMHPFVVYSQGITTTALGTKFNVKAYDSLETLTVHLQRGIVRVDILKAKENDQNRAYVLLPGNVLSYDRVGMTARVNTLIMDKGNSGHQLTKNRRKPSATIEKAPDNWYVFDNQRLSAVFDNLSSIYGVSIDYIPAEIQEMNFIGKINEREPLGTILNNLGYLNHLSVIKKDGAYIIRKIK